MHSFAWRMPDRRGNVTAINPHLAGYEDSASLVEDRALAWCKEMFQFPETSSGLFVSGGSVANLVGLTVARQAKAGFDVRRDGLYGRPRLTVYASLETHS